jgi:hypothetical protein
MLDGRWMFLQGFFEKMRGLMMVFYGVFVVDSWCFCGSEVRVFDLLKCSCFPDNIFPKGWLLLCSSVAGER